MMPGNLATITPVQLETQRFWAFFSFLFWPWIVVFALPATPGILLLYWRGHFQGWGSWGEALLCWSLWVLFTPVFLLQLAWRARHWKLVCSITLLLPIMLASLGSLFLDEPSGTLSHHSLAAQSPNWAHPFGTNSDQLDLFTLIVLSCRNSYIGLTISLLTILFLGVPLGVLQERPAWRNTIRIGFTSLETLPLLFGMMIIAALATLWIESLQQAGWWPARWRSTLRCAIVGGGIGVWLAPAMIQLVGERISFFRRQDFIDASLSNGIPLRRVLWYHIIYRNTLSEVLILTTHLASLAVLYEASLDYLFSIGTAKLGGGFYYSLAQLLSASEAKQAVLFMSDWWLFLFPTLFITATILGLLIHGDGLRDYSRERLEGSTTVPFDSLFDRLLGHTPHETETA